MYENTKLFQDIKLCRGNALFLILIAVALFAALSYAITQSGRGGGNIDRETAALDAANILQYAARLEQAVMRLRIVNGCKDTELNFASTGWSTPANYSNTTAPPDGSCDIFGANGGGVTYQKPPSTTGASEYSVTGGNTIYGIGQSVSDTDVASKDLVFFAYVTRQMCIAINTKLGIPNPSNAPPVVSVANGITVIPPGARAFKGTYDNDNAFGVTNRALEVYGYPSGCIMCTYASDCPTTQYQFYHVLLAR